MANAGTSVDEVIQCGTSGSGVALDRLLAAVAADGQYHAVQVAPDRLQFARAYRPTWAIVAGCCTVWLAGLGALFFLVKSTETCLAVIESDHRGTRIRLTGKLSSATLGHIRTSLASTVPGGAYDQVVAAPAGPVGAPPPAGQPIGAAPGVHAGVASPGQVIDLTPAGPVGGVVAPGAPIGAPVAAAAQAAPTMTPSAPAPSAAAPPAPSPYAVPVAPAYPPPAAPPVAAPFTPAPPAVPMTPAPPAVTPPVVTPPTPTAPAAPAAVPTSPVPESGDLRIPDQPGRGAPLPPTGQPVLGQAVTGQTPAARTPMDPDATITPNRPPAGSPVPVIVVDDGQRTQLGACTLIGRSPVAAPSDSAPVLVALEDPTLSVSKTHLAIIHDGQRWMAEDRYSTNGVELVRVDGSTVRLEPGVRQPVTVGETLRFGERTLRFEVEYR